MARAMSALGDVKPKAMRVISRILVLMDSILPLESPCSMQVRIAVRYLTMLRWSFTNAGMRQRRAQATHLSRASVAHFTTWKGTAHRTALGHRWATTVAIQAAPSAETWVIWSDRCGPNASKNVARVALSWPGAAQTSRPLSWLTTRAQILVATLVGDLINPDPRQVGELVIDLLRVIPDSGDDRPDGAPRDPHQLGDRSLRRLGGKPRDLCIEAVGVTGLMPGPRNGRHGHTISPTRHPRSVGFQIHLNRP